MNSLWKRGEKSALFIFTSPFPSLRSEQSGAQNIFRGFGSWCFLQSDSSVWRAFLSHFKCFLWIRETGFSSGEMGVDYENVMQG
jgi:hypothetical protein